MSVYALVIAVVAALIMIVDGFIVCYSYGMSLYVQEKKSELCQMHKHFSHT